MKRFFRVLRYVRPYWHLLAAGVLCSTATAAVILSFPWILRYLIDEVLGNKKPEMLAPTVGLLVIGAAVTVVLRALEQYFYVQLGGRALIDVRRDLARKLTMLPFSRLHRERTGQVMSLFTNDAPALTRLYETTLGPAVVSAFRFIAIIVIILAIFRELILLTLIAIPIYLVIPATLGRLTRRAGRTVQERNAEISADVQESVAAVRDIRAFNRERWHEDRLAVSFWSVFRPQLRLSVLQAASFATFLALWGVGGVIYLVGGRRVIGGEITLGLLLATIGYFNQLEEPISRFVNLSGQLQAALGAGDRILEFLDSPNDVADRAGAVTLTNCEGRVEFDNVCFAYDAVESILTSITFRAEPGQRIAIVGPSGAGKSTVVSLIPRFFEPSSGRVLLDGIDVRDYTVSSLRNSIGMVFQDTFLFAGTVRENIRFGGTGASEEEIIKAARLANAHQFIEPLPDGYETQIGERGVKLSGGQRQRLAIARAILRNPRILILDEATSALDSESELAVQTALEKLMLGRTSLVIAHRLSTVISSDAIVVLDKGRVVDIGTHDRLLRRCELYLRLHRLQFKPEKLEAEWEALHQDWESGGERGLVAPAGFKPV
ncbi:MAG TPA: ABC transporter ATP-binding protein [Blastocatellia bacterium]|nr:ABC transporter ATP-binding protein [Blastocatellia bacterium]